MDKFDYEPIADAIGAVLKERLPLRGRQRKRRRERLAKVVEHSADPFTASRDITTRSAAQFVFE